MPAAGKLTKHPEFNPNSMQSNTERKSMSNEKKVVFLREAHKYKMNSIGPNCNKLKKIYDSCFQNWFTNHFLKGETDDSMCREQFEQYRDCVRKAMKDQKIDLQQVEQNILNTPDEKKLRKLVKFKIFSIARRAVVTQVGFKNGDIIPPSLSCETGFNKYEFVKTGTSSLFCGKNVSLLSETVSNLSIKDSILRCSIVEPGCVTGINVGLPVANLVIKDLTLPGVNGRELIEPNSNVVEKKAKKSIIRIRKRKMKRHKYKKLQKKMKFIFAKIKMRRKAVKEKEFLGLITKIIDSGKNYNPEEELEENVKILKWEPPVTKVRGFLAPKSVVEEHLKEEELRSQINKRVEECLKKMS